MLRIAGTSAGLLLLLCGAWALAGITDDASQLPASEFQLVRMMYDSAGSFGRRRSWLTDAPEAETHLLDGVQRLTRLRTNGDSLAMGIMDARLYEYPFLYAVEVGRWQLSDSEADRLRDYLLHGGFLMVDDFHGTEEWQVFYESMVKVFPERAIVELQPDDAVFHVAYEVDQSVQIPGIRGAITGQHWEKDGYTPHWRGIVDDDGRLMVVINYNMDLGDAWEHADNPQYPATLTLMAYRFAIDYILYAMTH
jgi:hypothetical protein